MGLQSLLDEFARRFGIAGAKLDAELACQLVVGGDTLVTIEGDDADTTALFTSHLCHFPGDTERLALFDAMMEAHSYGLATDDAYFGASRGTGHVVLFKRLDLPHVDETAFIAAVESFVTVYQFWKTLIDSGRFRQQQAVQPPDRAVPELAQFV